MSATETSSTPAARFVGQSVTRVEDPRLLTGHGRYVDDIVLPGMLHAAFLRSDLAHARITHLDVEEARSAPGVHTVLVGDDLNPLIDSIKCSLYPPDSPGPPPLVLAGDDVRFVGDPVAIVLADNRYLAEDALELIEIDYEPLPAVVDYETAAERTDLVHPENGSNMASTMEIPFPGIDEVFAGAAHVVTETFHQHRQTNVPMETRGIVADWQGFANRADLYLSTQSPHEAMVTGARVLGVGENQVRVHMGDVGGGFGQKMFLGREELSVMLATRAAGRPVKWIEDRRENLMAANMARIEKMTVEMAIDADGKILGARLDHLDDTGAFPGGGGAGSGALACMQFPGPYAMPAVSWKSTTVYTNTVGRSAYRGPWQMESLAREEMMDRVAREIGLDPLEFRRRNILGPDALPHTTATGLTYERISPTETMEQAVEMIGYDELRAEQARALAQGRHLGIGLAVYVEPSAMRMGPLGSEGATVRVEPDGKVNLFMGVGSHGQSLETTMAQLVADELGVDIADITLHQGHGTPYGFGTGGSRSAVTGGGAARAAASGLRSKVLNIASELLEASPDDLEMTSSVISVKGTPTAALRLVDVATVAYSASETLPDGMEGGLEYAARYTAPPTTYSNAAHACLCELDPATGKVELLRYIVSEDCGVMINPMVVEGQIAGGVVQGLGGVLYEDAAYDEDGNPLATTFLDYLIPTTTEVPDLEYGHVVTPSDSPGGHKGMGEGGAIGAPPCVFNAVADALSGLGVITARQPLTPDAIIALLAD